jgi:hypothetical protein
MKKLVLIALLCISSRIYSQTASTADYGDRTNFAIGLPKATHSELKLIKEELSSFDQIIYSEYFFNDHILLIECDPRPQKPLDYETIEAILFKYFGHDHVMRKYIVSFSDLKAQGEKTDKFTIK